MNSTPATEDLPPSLKLLKWLVMTLTATMILGVIAIVVVFVTRMPDGNAPIALPATISLPQGVTAQAITMGRDYIAVVTQDNRILILNSDSSLRQDIKIIPAPLESPTANPTVAPAQ